MTSYLGANSKSGGNSPGNTADAAPKNAKYITLDTTPDLTQNRKLAAGENISIVDNGPGGTLTINSLTQQIPASAPLDASYLTIAGNGSLSNERILSAGDGIVISDGGPGNSLTISNLFSSGTITLSLPTAEFHEVERIVNYSGITANSFILGMLTANDDFDGDDLSDCKLILKAEDEKIRINLSCTGPMVGNYKINYMVKI